MTKIKLCGLTRLCDVEMSNTLRPDYVGFVFAAQSKRAMTPSEAQHPRERLAPEIAAVGVFVNAPMELVADLLNRGIVHAAQLHGNEDDTYIGQLRQRTRQPILQAIRIRTPADVRRAQRSRADMVLLDAGAGTGTVFDWNLLKEMQRPYFLAGGLTADNAGHAIRQLHPYGVDVSSGIESNGRKDAAKMAEFVAAIRKEDAQ